MTVAITDDTGRVLGHAARVLDFSNAEPGEMGGRDPRAPLTLGTLLVRGELRVGHTFAASDPDAPIWMEEQPVTAGSGWYQDFRCESCVTKSNLAYQAGATWIILEHKGGCRWLREIAKRYPR